jgi:hypothetical protein
MRRLVFGLICLIPSTAYAQFIPQFNVPMAIVNPAIDVAQIRRDHSEPDTGRPPNEGRAESRTLDAASFIFQPSIQLRRTNLASFVAKSRKTDPQGAAAMEQLFASVDIMSQIDEKMRETYGMRANNVADAYAVWWSSAWMGAQGRSDDPTPKQMAMVKQQAIDALAATPAFAGASDAAKQELAEALLVQAALIGAAVETYGNDPATLAKVRTAIAEGAKAAGVDLNAMKLTDAGFVSN